MRPFASGIFTASSMRTHSATRLALAHALVVHQDLGHLVADPHIGVQRGHRILKHHGDVVGADRVDHRQRARSEFPCPSNFDRSARGAVLGQKPHDGKGQLAFARAAFADDAQRLAAVQREATRR